MNKYVLKLLYSLAIMIAIFLITKISSKLIDKWYEKQKDLKIPINRKRSKTLGQVLKSVIRYAAYFFGIMAIVDVVFGRVAVTFAGFGGVVVGFAAQSIIKDVFNGFFILFENQFSVGDYITIDDKSGMVESIELRFTRLRGLNGDLHIIPNGIIAKVTNHSRGNMKVDVDVEVPYDRDIDKLVKQINKVCMDISHNNAKITAVPKVIGISSLKQDVFTLKISGRVKPMAQWEIESRIRTEVKKILYPKLKEMEE